MENEKGYIFIADILDIEEFDEHEIINGYILKRANAEQINKIRAVIPTSNTTFDFFSRYELNPKKLKNGVYEEIDAEEASNYWIVEYDEKQANHDLKIALLLSEIELTSLFEVLTFFDGGVLKTQEIFFNYIAENYTRFEAKKVTKKDLEKVTNTYELICEFRNIKNDFKYINKAIDDYYSLQLISKKSFFRTVGYFSIFESLLVHNPSRNGDSGITHQLKTKLSLVHNRFEDPIDFKEFFKSSNSVKFITLIEKLYKFRSEIAHGDFSDFENELQIITGKKEADKFLNLLLKKVMLQAICEPRLIDDLKKC